MDDNKATSQAAADFEFCRVSREMLSDTMVISHGEPAGEPACERCRWWVEADGSKGLRPQEPDSTRWGDCCRRAPVGGQCPWANVRDTDFCGEFAVAAKG
jgi:hypothetical protein